MESPHHKKLWYSIILAHRFFRGPAIHFRRSDLPPVQRVVYRQDQGQHEDPGGKSSRFR
jgi:hypothetical protein